MTLGTKVRKAELAIGVIEELTTRALGLPEATASMTDRAALLVIARTIEDYNGVKADDERKEARDADS